MLCPGSQNDISVYGNLLFLSTDSSRSDDSCNSTSQPATEKSSWEGIKIFDISDKTNPKYIKSVETACGSHTHTLVPGKRARERLPLRLLVLPERDLPRLPAAARRHLDHQGAAQEDPTKAAVVALPGPLPATAATRAGPPTRASPRPPAATTSPCYPSKDLAAGACMGDGILFDITDPENPKVIDQVQDNVNFAFWHSATFNKRGQQGRLHRRARRRRRRPPATRPSGRTAAPTAIYDIVGRGDQRKLVFKSYFKIPRHQADTENCVAHNGSLIPVKGKDIMVQAWYQGGVSVWDFTDSAQPKEIAYFERGPLTHRPRSDSAASWSAYYYNGYIYSNDIAKGLDVLKLNDRRTDTAKWVRMDELNVQTQPDYR